MKGVLVLLLAAGALVPETAIRAPVIGCFVDRAGSVRFLTGIRGQFVVSQAVLREVREAACTSRGNIAVTADSLVEFDADGAVLDQRPVPEEGPPRIELARELREPAVDLDGPVVHYQALARDWAVARTERAAYAVTHRAGRIEVYLLPEPPP